MKPLSNIQTSNIHTHSTWCDGANTAREIAERALALGFTDLGFSSHSPVPFDERCPGIQDECAYRAEIAALKREYAGRLCILCGVEQDTYATVNPLEYDYIIHSTHYLPLRGEDYVSLVAADGEQREVLAAREEVYGGDGIAMARAFFDLSVEGVRLAKPQVVGHYDVIAKYNENSILFDEESPAYQAAALEYLDDILDVIAPYGGMVEVNTGALARGLRNVPYPAPFILKHMAQRGARAIITSDSHNVDTLNAYFGEALALLRAAGFSFMAVLQGGVFRDVGI